MGAVNTYRSYSSAQAGLERNIERLSSGLRINRAAGDSAGLAISQRMNNQINSILGRMRELAVQSASDGLNADDRASIDLEFQQLKSEISRIGNGTEYNGMTLINGDRQKSTSLTGSGLNTILSRPRMMKSVSEIRLPAKSRLCINPILEVLRKTMSSTLISWA